MPIGSLQDIRTFLSTKRIGMEIVPATPTAPEIEGFPCAAKIADVQPLPEAALPDAVFFHRLHGFFTRMAGRYPR